MTHPAPPLATYKLAIAFSIGGFTHHVEPWVDVQVGSGTTGWDAKNEESDLIDIGDLVALFSTSFGTLAPTGMTAAGYTLYQLESGSLVPIFVGSWSLTPSGGVVAYQGKQWTWVGRDADLYVVKHELIEIIAGDFQHFSDRSTIPASPFGNYTGHLVGATASDFGSFFLNKNKKHMKTFRGLTCGPNRKWRRKRGLA